jgi:hypothetical protein
VIYSFASLIHWSYWRFSACGHVISIQVQAAGATQALVVDFIQDQAGAPTLVPEGVCTQGREEECIPALAVDSTQDLAEVCTPDPEEDFILALVEDCILAPVVGFTPDLEVGCIPGQGSRIEAIFRLGMFL